MMPFVHQTLKVPAGAMVLTHMHAWGSSITASERVFRLIIVMSHQRQRCIHVWGDVSPEPTDANASESRMPSFCQFVTMQLQQQQLTTCINLTSVLPHLGSGGWKSIRPSACEHCTQSQPPGLHWSSRAWHGACRADTPAGHSQAACHGLAHPW